MSSASGHGWLLGYCTDFWCSLLEVLQVPCSKVRKEAAQELVEHAFPIESQAGLLQSFRVLLEEAVPLQY